VRVSKRAITATRPSSDSDLDDVALNARWLEADTEPREFGVRREL